MKNESKKKCAIRLGSKRGFTLIELLVSIFLSVILIGTIVQTFITALEVFERGTARLDIYKNIRSAMDVMERDLIGAISTEGNEQRFVLAQNVDGQFSGKANGAFGDPSSFGKQNGWIMDPGTPSSPKGGAADLLGFIGTDTLAGSNNQVGYTYRIVPFLDSSLLDEGKGSFNTIHHNRILCALQRVTIHSASTINGKGKPGSGKPELYYGPDPNQTNSGKLWRSDNTGSNVSVGYLSKYILSFNIEVLSGTTQSSHTKNVGFIDLNTTDSTGTEPAALSAREKKYTYPTGTDPADFRTHDYYPIGDRDPSNPDPPLPEALRITLRFTDSRSELQERVVQRVFWIPSE